MQLQPGVYLWLVISAPLSYTALTIVSFFCLDITKRMTDPAETSIASFDFDW